MSFFTIICLVALILGCNSPLITLDLCVETVPPGASIILDGKEIGKTPKTVAVQSSDSVTIKLDGYEDKIIEPKETSAPRTFKFIELKKLHDLYFDYKPYGAKVYNSENQMLGVTPFEIQVTRGEKTFHVRFPHHEELVDTFIVTGAGMKTTELIPIMKYFPETLCNITTTPNGASVKSLVACDKKLLGEFDDWGQTPVNGTNADVMEAKCDRLFFFTHQDYYPAALRFRGSIKTNLELEPKKSFNIPNLPKKSTKDIKFKTGLIEGGNQVFDTTFEEGYLKVFSTKYHIPVEVIDLRTKKSKFSGASWWDERFFVVRFEGKSGDEKFLIYDSRERRRLTFSDFGLYHERNIPGVIRWEEQIPSSPSSAKDFYEVRYVTTNAGMFFYLKLFSGVDCWFVIKYDTHKNNSQLVDILFE